MILFGILLKKIHLGGCLLARKIDVESEKPKEQNTKILPLPKREKEDEISQLNYMLGVVMKYISDDEIEEIDIEYLLDHTDGLRAWWENYRELDRKKVMEEIKTSLGSLTLEELNKIHEQIQKKE